VTLIPLMSRRWPTLTSNHPGAPRSNAAAASVLIGGPFCLSAWGNAVYTKRVRRVSLSHWSVSALLRAFPAPFLTDRLMVVG